MNTILKSEFFNDWLVQLGDQKARFAIIARIRRAELGNLGDHKNLGDGLSEMRINFGPGYRLYYTIEGTSIYILLCGGDKSTQRADIEKARRMIAERGNNP